MILLDFARKKRSSLQPLVIREAEVQSTVLRSVETPVQMRQPIDERRLKFDYNDLRSRITVKPLRMGNFELEGPLTGEVRRCACIEICRAITIKHGMEDTLSISIAGIGEIKGATMFSVVQTEEQSEMQIRPGNVLGSLSIRFAEIIIDIGGQNAVLKPVRTAMSQDQIPLSNLQVA